ncbi:STM3941 family protein [Anaerosporobacter faecicola]|uniref:STM3941 family protein n=1 Tax=Anaerosporobacter faecicola TaxID=2718714 RepID=UPI001439F7CF|nr:STM3941 family protein [Anaerosporobacter faecicola]
MKETIIYEKKKQAIKLLVQTLLMVAAAVVVLYLGIDEKSLLFCMIGGVGCVFFGICLIVQFIRVLHKKPLFTITQEGIMDQSTLTSINFIPYEEIEELVIGKTLNKDSIGIYLKDVEAFKKVLPSMKQKAIESNINNKFPPILLRVDSVEGMTGHEIYDILREAWEKTQNNREE